MEELDLELTPEELALFAGEVEEEEKEEKDDITSKETDKEENEENETAEEETEKETEETDEDEETDEGTTKNDDETIDIEINGQIVSLSKEEAIELAKEKALEKIKEDPLREDLEFIKQNNLTKEDLALLRDIKNGNVEALAAIVPEDKIEELLEKLDTGVEYKPKFEIKEKTPLEKNLERLEQDQDLVNGIERMLEVVPKDNVLHLLASEEATKVLEWHIKQDTLDDVIEKATKLRLKGEDWDRAIFYASQEVVDSKRSKTTEKGKEERKNRIKEVFQEKQSKGKKSSLSEEDIWELPEEELEKIDLSKLL